MTEDALIKMLEQILAEEVGGTAAAAGLRSPDQAAEYHGDDDW